MRELSKFKVFTVVFLCLFLFTVGAIYTNTKEMVENTTNSKRTSTDISKTREINIEQRNARKNMNNNVRDLNEKLNELTKRVNAMDDNRNKMNCKIQGVMGVNGLEPLGEEASLNELRINGKELVMTCSF